MDHVRVQSSNCQCAILASSYLMITSSFENGLTVPLTFLSYRQVTGLPMGA